MFLRELAQNARDAGASRIDVSSSTEGDEVVVTFTDDGCGMSYAHARRYLFTLYASSKETDARSAGRYGVGFWSVLLFDPDHILIESMTSNGESWAMSFDGGLGHQSHVSCGIGARGTRVTIRKRIADPEDAKILAMIEDSIARQCRYLRRNDRGATILAVSHNGKRIDRPFSVSGPCWMAFKCGNVEGAIGLGHTPSVELYARGLLVWKGTTINELKYGAEAIDDNTHPEGLAPVYIINGNDLSVTLDRRAVVDDKELARVRRVARRRMRELVGRYLDSISRRPLHERFRDWIAGLWEDLRLGRRLIPIAAVISLLLLVVAALLFAPGLLRRWRPSEEPEAADAAPEILIVAPPASTPHSENPARGGFQGPMVEPLGASPSLMLTYEPPTDVNFRTAVASALHPGRGIVASASGSPPRPAPAYRCAAGCLDVSVVVASGPGRLSIPVPTGHRVEPSSGRIDGNPAGKLQLDGEGQPFLLLDSPINGTLRYRTGPGTEPLEPRRWNDLLRVPSRMRLPPAYASVAATAAAADTTEEKVATITVFVRSLIAYDRSPATAAAYRKFLSMDPKTGWTEFVTAIGRGDCDVKNTLAVLMLRRSGVPSRLAIGIAGVEGKAAPGMHAWTEYHDGTWVPADATGAPARQPTTGEPSLARHPPATLPPAAAEPAATPIPEPPSAAPDSSGPGITAGLPRTIAIAAALVAAFFGTLGLILLLAGRGYRRMNAPGGRDVRQKIAAKMLMGALVQPEIWLRGSGLSSRRLLPVLGRGKKMSLDEAAGLGARGTLWYSTGKSQLARLSVARGARILDASDDAFGEIVSRIAKAVNLDRVSGLRPLYAESLPEEQISAGRLIEELDRLVSLAGWPEGTVAVSPGLSGAMCRDVHLEGLGAAFDGFPSTFIAVSPANSEVARRARLMEKRPGLAAFMLLDLVLPASEILAADRELIRKLAALEALGVET